MEGSVLGPGERSFLEALNALGVPYMLVGMSAALLQGASGATLDMDLWFEDASDPRIGQAARRAGGRPPALGGDALGDRFDVVVHMHGLRTFADEIVNTREMTIDGVAIRVLALERIAASKRATGRPKDLAQIPALEEAICALEERVGRGDGER